MTLFAPESAWPRAHQELADEAGTPVVEAIRTVAAAFGWS